MIGYSKSDSTLITIPQQKSSSISVNNSVPEFEKLLSEKNEALKPLDLDDKDLPYPSPKIERINKYTFYVPSVSEEYIMLNLNLIYYLAFQF